MSQDIFLIDISYFDQAIGRSKNSNSKSEFIGVADKKDIKLKLEIEQELPDLNVDIERIVRYVGDDPTFEMFFTDGTSIMLGDVEGLINHRILKKVLREGR